MTITAKSIAYEIDGAPFDGVLYTPADAAGPLACVMVCHAWGGRGEHEEKVAERLATQGYAAFAADVYGTGVRGSSVEECAAIMTPLKEDRGLLLDRLMAAHVAMSAEAACDESRSAVIGYCFGGLCALDMARANGPVRGAAAFHALLDAPSGAGTDAISPKIVAYQGYDDPMAGPDAQAAFAAEMTARGADWQLHLYGGVAHAFTNVGANNTDLGLIYDEAADRRSWAALTEFLADALG